MKEQIQLELDSDLLEKSEEILDYFGLDTQTAVKILLTRITQEKNVQFLFNKQFLPKEENESKVNEIATKTMDNSEVKFMASQTGKMTKNIAISSFRKNGYTVYPTVTFASKNRSAYNYWANPNFDVLKGDWSLILNDNIAHKLYLFNIPAGSIMRSQLTPRADITYLIDLQIRYRNINYTDSRSDYSFLPYLVAELSY